MLNLQFPDYNFQLKDIDNSRKIFDVIRKKYVVLTPEEWVRQNILHYFLHEMNYPKGLISVEKEIKIHNLKKRYDMVIFDQHQKPWMLVECKEPGVNISNLTLEQLMRYHQVMQCPFWMLSNGNKSFCAKVNSGNIEWLYHLPPYNS